MPLTRRGQHRAAADNVCAGKRDEMKPPRLNFRRIAAALGTLVVLCSVLTGGETSTTELLQGAEKGVRTVRREVSKEASLLIKLRLPEEATREARGTVIARGPHMVELQLTGSTTNCPYPRFWMRLVGDALVGVHLEQDIHEKRVWRGSFTLPMAGNYKVETRWYGCIPQKTWVGLDEPVELSSEHFANDLTTRLSRSPLFADSAWVATTTSGRNDKLSQYVWKRPQKESLPDKVIRLDDTTVPVLVEGTTRQPDGFYKFGELGNYELVCFMGSKTMNDIREKFLALRGHVAAHQRPFKFHYYNVTDLVHPDKDWSRDQKERVRKCKHILVSVDEVENPVSQSDYRDLMKTFVGHLLKLMNDETFPIWIFTVNDPPMHATNCYNPYGGRTTDNPCNDALKDLFRSKTFPERVHLLDNTDLTLPQFDENRDDILAVIALRVFVFVGKRVAEWRAVGQMGMIDGLHRNGSVEPNFELVPYSGWS